MVKFHSLSENHVNSFCVKLFNLVITSSVLSLIVSDVVSSAQIAKISQSNSKNKSHKKILNKSDPKIDPCVNLQEHPFKSCKRNQFLSFVFDLEEGHVLEKCRKDKL